MIEDYLANFQHDDFLANAACSQLGKTVNMVDLVSRQAYEKTPFYNKFASRWGMQQALSTCWIEPVYGLVSFLSLWRKAARYAFSERERAELECLVPHLAEAHRICRISTLRQSDKVFRQAMAICNLHGTLIEVEPGFFELLLTEWPAWRRNSNLPKELRPVLTQQQVCQGKAVIVDARLLGNKVLIYIGPSNALDKLGKQQKVIALRYAAGASYQDIAQALGLAESTVRNHVACIFKKCHVHNKIELAALIQKY